MPAVWVLRLVPICLFFRRSLQTQCWRGFGGLVRVVVHRLAHSHGGQIRWLGRLRCGVHHGRITDNACGAAPVALLLKESRLPVIKGLVASVVASFLFGAIYYLSPFLAPLGGEQIFGWRVLLTLPFTTLLLLWWGEGAQVRALAQRVRQRPLLGLGLVLSAALLGVQLWIFMWAPLHGRALPVSLGYFLLPLVLVLVGRWLYRERLTRGQLLASALASAGVAYEVLRTGGLSWETALVSVGYTVYFMLRRYLRTQGLAGHWLDMLLLTPAALWFILHGPTSWQVVVQTPALQVLLPGLGLVSAVALALYMAASRWLPMGLFGLLSYVEPVLLVVVALVLGESLAPGQWPTYALVFAAVGTLVLEGVWRLLRRPNALAQSAPARASGPT